MKNLELNFDPNDILYHGTIDIYARLIQTKGIKIITRVDNGVDFGPGFYLTVGQEEQAFSLAYQRFQNPPAPNSTLLSMLEISRKEYYSIQDNFRPAVIKYRIRNIEEWLQFRHRIFFKDDNHWKKYVWTWRQAYSPPEDIDWIFGPVADGGFQKERFNTIRAFPNMNQLSIHNEQISTLLELMEVIIC